MRTCGKCKIEQGLDSYHGNGYGGLRPDCKTCCNEVSKVKARARREADPEGTRAYQRAYLLRKTYGVESSDVDAQLALQGGVCAICGKAPSEKKGLSLDHNHDCGSPRGMLCDSCNLALGLFQDDVLLLSLAIEYLKNPPWEGNK